MCAALLMGGSMSKSWKRARRESYLAAWPVHRQLEAMQDAVNGDSSKLQAMNEEFAAIRAANPKPESGAQS